jgi:hypothetical protein
MFQRSGIASKEGSHASDLAARTFSDKGLEPGFV